VGLGMLLLHKLLDERQTLADVLGLRFDFGFHCENRIAQAEDDLVGSDLRC
jgi:hypothetical protein